MSSLNRGGKLYEGWFSYVKMIGYEGPIVLEMEDLTMVPLTGVKKSMNVLKETLPREFDILT
ncbi:hypothetical protein ACDZ29_14895 [Peribacillus sp. RS7]|uniref:hypothetical protein n=1 Tax=Peribacillus sp. RS7 TaxID=3242679 RepID=UPI0035C0C4AE